MDTLYTKSPMVIKLKKAFYEIFSEERRSTRENLCDLLLSVLCLNGFKSVKHSYDHFMKPVSNNSLNSYYFTLNESKIDIDKWMQNMIKVALSVVPKELSRWLIILSIDDTMVEKYGEHFENRGLLFDHAKHNGSNYLNGHCFVSLMMSIPVFDNGKIRYLSFPVGYRMWTKEKTKLAMAAEMVQEVMKCIGIDRNVCLCCDSWYPKAEITELPIKYSNLALICNVRYDTVLYDLPPAKTGKKGRPKIRGNRLSFDNFKLTDVEGTDYSVGSHRVITNLFGHIPVYAVVTRTKSGTERLFICTKSPDELNFDVTQTDLGKSSLFAKAGMDFLSLTIYSLRWHIEVAYYEQKKFWSLGVYMLRSRIGIERLINLLTVLYAFMTLLPFYDCTFITLSHSSPQQSRFVIGMTIWYELFFATFETAAYPLKMSFLLFQCLVK
ncbi:MAG: transposase [Alphaproteobacteria bacterium]|nr:transposase [Alphaproteobacteria bacterium]